MIDCLYRMTVFAILSDHWLPGEDCCHHWTPWTRPSRSRSRPRWGGPSSDMVLTSPSPKIAPRLPGAFSLSSFSSGLIAKPPLFYAYLHHLDLDEVIIIWNNSNYKLIFVPKRTKFHNTSLYHGYKHLITICWSVDWIVQFYEVLWRGAFLRNPFHRSMTS